MALALRTGAHRLTGNPFLTLAVAADAALVLAALYWTPLQALLGTEPFRLADLGFVAAASLAGATAAASKHTAALRRRPPHASGQRRPPSAGRTR